MFDIFRAAGWLLLPISLCSVATVAIVLERFWALRQPAVMPENLVEQIRQLHQAKQLTETRIAELRANSGLGRMLAAGLVNREHSREIMKESIQDTGRQVVAEMERYLDMLGTIASVAPLLGLLGTVIGMIDVFSVITDAGVGDPQVLAGGISKALLTTAAGLSVAIPALLFHRYFNSRVTRLAIGMEEQSLHLVEVIKGEREPEPNEIAGHAQ
ncbi:biopolymer transporter ExbB [Rhabdochromatium marinum]|nr:biopolymer transporter ExbB [Rhabdochromatium marinum]